MALKFDQITVGHGTEDERILKVVDKEAHVWACGRLTIVASIEDGTVSLHLENPKESGRSNQHMWLSEESFIKLIVTCIYYLDKRGKDLPKMLDEYELKYKTNERHDKTN